MGNSVSGVSGLGYTHVEFGMYPFASVAWAWDELWSAVHARAPWSPAELTRSGDVHARWYDADCVVTQVCGGPFAAQHRHDMHLVGAFAVDLDDADGAVYRSVLLSPHDAPLDVLLTDGCRAVANSADSLSGWLSLTAATVGPGRAWPWPITFTSAHLDSVRALAKGEADLASIDSWSLALIVAEEPDLLDGLHRVGTGPWVPTPAIAARRSVPEHDVDMLRTAFAAALSDDSTVAARRALHIAGFSEPPLDDYLATLALRPD